MSGILDLVIIFYKIMEIVVLRNSIGKANCIFINYSMLKQGSKLKKSPSRLLVTNWRNIVARCKFLVTSLYNVNDAAHSISLASDI